MVKKTNTQIVQAMVLQLNMAICKDTGFDTIFFWINNSKDYGAKGKKRFNK